MRLRIKENKKDVALLEVNALRYMGEYNNSGKSLYRIVTANNETFNLVTDYNDVINLVCGSISLPYVVVECESFSRFS